MQTKRQVSILEARSVPRILTHLLRFRRMEVRISDAESALYGFVFAVLLGLVVFNVGTRPHMWRSHRVPSL